MASEAEREYIREKLLPDLLSQFEGWAKEYQQPRDLGERGEFASLYRKVRKLKTVIWDGVEPTGWREGIRTIVTEVIAHALLLLCDLDGVGRQTIRAGKGDKLIVCPTARMVVLGNDALRTGDYNGLSALGVRMMSEIWSAPVCSSVCQAGHSFWDECSYRLRLVEAER